MSKVKHPYLVVKASTIYSFLSAWREAQLDTNYQIQFIEYLQRLADNTELAALEAKGGPCAVIPLTMIRDLDLFGPSRLVLALVFGLRFIRSRGYARFKLSLAQELSGISLRNLKRGISLLIKEGYLTKVKLHPNCVIKHGSKYTIGPRKQGDHIGITWGITSTVLHSLLHIFTIYNTITYLYLLLLPTPTSSYS